MHAIYNVYACYAWKKLCFATMSRYKLLSFSLIFFTQESRQTNQLNDLIVLQFHFTCSVSCIISKAQATRFD